MNSVELHNISKNFKDFSLKDINLEIPKGRIVGLIGANGAGKTSIIKIILGLTNPDKGIGKLLGVENSKKKLKYL